MTLPDDAHDKPANKRRLWVAIALGAVAVLLVGGYAATVAAVSGDVPAGTSVRGVDIGGMTTEQAEAGNIFHFTWETLGVTTSFARAESPGWSPDTRAARRLKRQLR